MEEEDGEKTLCLPELDKASPPDDAEEEEEEDCAASPGREAMFSTSVGGALYGVGLGCSRISLQVFDVGCSLSLSCA